jgi:hypothetical protein
MSPNEGGGWGGGLPACGVSANENSCAHGDQINFGDLTPYLWCVGESRLIKIFHFLFVFQIWEGGKLSWHVKYQRVQARDAKEGGSAVARGGPEGAQEGEGGSSTFLRGPRLRHRLEVKKDDVQAVIPISKVIPFFET